MICLVFVCVSIRYFSSCYCCCYCCCICALSKCQLVHSTVTLAVTHTQSCCHKAECLSVCLSVNGRAPTHTHTHIDKHAYTHVVQTELRIRIHFKLLTLARRAGRRRSRVYWVVAIASSCCCCCMPPNKCLQIFRGISPAAAAAAGADWEANKVKAQTRFMCICKFF